MPHCNREFSRRSFSIILALVLFCFVNANAGTGYVDANGKWHFNVVLVQPATGTPIDQGVWTDILELADEFLYLSTNGKHQFGTVTIASTNTYDALADVIVWRGADISRADVYGLNRLGYHVFMSDLLLTRTMPPPLSQSEVAKALIHELGHYLYSLYDEYIPPPESSMPMMPKVCIDRSFRMMDVDDAACLMESCNPCPGLIGTWCFFDNHEVHSGNNRTTETWQSQHNLGMSCWSKMKSLYPIFRMFNVPSDTFPQVPNLVDRTHFVPLPAPAARASQTELVVAIDASIDASTPFNAENTLIQILDRALASFPDPPGKVVLMRYNATDFNTTPTDPAFALEWSSTSSLATTYRAELAGIPLPPSPGVTLQAILQKTAAVFDDLSAGAAGISRTFLLITSGSENSSTTFDPALLSFFHSQAIRGVTNFVVPENSIDPLVKAAHYQMAVGIGGAVYDATFNSVRVSQAVEAAGKQLICVQTLNVPSPSPAPTFFVYPLPENTASMIVGVSWPDPACQVRVTIQDVDVTDNQGDNISLPTFKGRRLGNFQKGSLIQVEASLPNNCNPDPFPITISISDEKPDVFLTASAERPIYGFTDRQVVHGRVTSPYPLINLDQFSIGEINDQGEFADTSANANMALDDGVTFFDEQTYSGDWVKGDGIYSRNVRTGGPSGLRTVRVRAINAGKARSATGEAFSNDSLAAVPAFRRETFVTYFVDSSQATTFSEDAQFTPAANLNSVNGIARVTGGINLTPSYPHAYRINGTVTIVGTAISAPVRIEANYFEADLAVGTLSSAQLSVLLDIFYRTGEKKSVSDDAFFMITGIENETKENTQLPKEFQLYPSHPNPFNLSTRLTFDVPQKRSEISLIIYDVMGRKVRTLIAGQFFTTGTHETEWDGRNDGGTLVDSGVYFVRMRAGNWKQVRKIVLMK